MSCCYGRITHFSSILKVFPPAIRGKRVSPTIVAYSSKIARRSGSATDLCDFDMADLIPTGLVMAGLATTVVTTVGLIAAASISVAGCV